MSIFNQINDDIKQAMRAKEKEKLEALRAVKSAFLLAKTETGTDEIPEEKEIQIIQKLVKQRRESASIYTEQNRAELAQKESDEADIIAAYLPAQMSAEEVEAVIVEIIAKVGATSTADMGKVMGMASKQLAGKAEGKIIAQIVRGKLA